MVQMYNNFYAVLIVARWLLRALDVSGSYPAAADWLSLISSQSCSINATRKEEEEALSLMAYDNFSFVCY